MAAGKTSGSRTPAKKRTTGRTARATAKKKKAAAAKRKAAAEPHVKLGEMAANGICASMFGLLERGVARRPKIARSTTGHVVLRFKENFSPMRVRFEEDEIVVEDVDGSAAKSADLVVSGSLPDIVHLASAPLVGGVPRLTHPRGRAALARLSNRRVKIEGSPLLARRLLKILEI